MGLALALAALSASAAPALPNPCKLITVAEIEQIAGPLKEAPKAEEFMPVARACGPTAVLKSPVA